MVYSLSYEIWTQFWCSLSYCRVKLWFLLDKCELFIINIHYSCFPRLFHWHGGNRMIALMPVPASRVSLSFKGMSKIDCYLIMLIIIKYNKAQTLQWRHNWRGGVSNHEPYDGLLNCLLRRRSKKISKLHVIGPSSLWGEFTGDRWIPPTNGQ